MARRPSTNGPNGQGERDTRGRFRTGNPGGPGNPKSGQRTRFWHAWMDRVAEDHVEQVYAAVFKAACNGDMEAARIFLDRTLGKVAEHHEEPPSNTQSLFDMADEAHKAMVAEAAAQVNRMTAEAFGIRISTEPTG